MGAGVYRESREEGDMDYQRCRGTVLSQLLTGSWGGGVELPSVRLAHPTPTPPFLGATKVSFAEEVSTGPACTEQGILWESPQISTSSC